MLEEKMPAPQFSLQDDEGNTYTIDTLHGKKFILYFYPKDDTPGCTVEACNFRDTLAEFDKRGIQVFGVSKDTRTSHKKFKEKYHLNFPLLYDTDAKTCQTYGVLKEKSMLGRKYMGIAQTTFLIDENGNIEKVWNQVNPAVHTEEIFRYLDAS